MSRRHARIVVRGDTAKLEDLESRNGVFRNGVKIDSVDIATGDTLRFGAVEVFVEVPAPVVPRSAADDARAHHLPPAGVTGQGRRDRLRRREARAASDERRWQGAGRVAFAPGSPDPRRGAPPGEHPRGESGAPPDRPCDRRARAHGVAPPGRQTGAARHARQQDAHRPRAARTGGGSQLRRRRRFAVRERPQLYKAKVRSLICGPLSTQNENIGVLSMDNALARRFSEADLELFTALANYASTAIAQARLSSGSSMRPSSASGSPAITRRRSSTSC